MPKIAVYLRNEVPFAQAATHSATRTVWTIVVADGSGKLVTQDKRTALHLTTQESWRELKGRLKPSSSIKDRLIPRTKGVDVGNLDLCYPEAGRETVRHPHEAMRLACAVAQALLDAEAP